MFSFLILFQNLPSVSISALGEKIKSSKYDIYSCGLIFPSALTLNLNEGFKKASNLFLFHLFTTRTDERIESVVKLKHQYSGND